MTEETKTTEQPSLPSEAAVETTAVVESVSVAESTAPATEATAYDDATVAMPELESEAVVTTPVVFFEGYSIETLEDLYVKTALGLGAEVFVEKTKQAGSFENLLTLALYERSAESERALEAVERHVKRMQNPEKNFSDQLRDDEGKLVLTMGTPQAPATPGSGPKTVAGEAGRLEFAKRRRGAVRRIPLYNTGFQIVVCAPTPDQLYTLINAMQSDFYTYGRDFGAHFHMYNDLLLKKAVVDMLSPRSGGVTIQANFRAWDRGNNLIDQIRLHDLPHILTGLASTMFPDGYRFKHFCDHEGCTHVEEHLIDVRKLIRHDFAMMPPACIDKMRFNNVDEANAEQTAEYRRQLHGDTVVRFGDLGFRLQVPSLAGYLAAGDEFIASMLRETQASTKRDVLSAVAYRQNRIFTPWVKEVMYYKADGTVELQTPDPMVISEELMAVQLEDTSGVFDRQMMDFMADSQVSHICYPAFKCPSCGNVPKTRNGFLTVDPIRSFFTMSMLRLTNNSPAVLAGPST